MNSDAVNAALAGALFLAGPITVAVATTGIGPYSWTTTTGLLLACVYALLLAAGTYGPVRVDRLWSFRPVRAVVWWSLLGLFLGLFWGPVSDLELSADVGVGPSFVAIAAAGLSLGGGLGLVLTLGRANHRRIASERGPLLELGRATGETFAARWTGVVLVPLGLLYVTRETGEMLQGSGPGLGSGIGGVLLGLLVVVTGLDTVSRNWQVSGDGLLRRYRVYSWEDVDRVVVNDETVTTYFESNLAALSAGGLRGSPTFSRDSFDDRALELLETRTDVPVYYQSRSEPRSAAEADPQRR